MAATKTWRVALEGTGGDGAQLVAVFHIKDQTPLDADLRTAHQMADEIDSWLTTHWLAMSDSAYVLNDIKVTSDVRYWLGEVADQYVKVKNLSGTLAGNDGDVPRGSCAWAKLTVASVFKGNHGGIHSSPIRHSGYVNSSGKLTNPSTFRTAFANVCTDLTTGHDYTAGLGHLSLVLYSTTRRKRGDANWYFDATGLTISPDVHFLRSRISVP